MHRPLPARPPGRLALTATVLALAAVSGSALASSHREAPNLAINGRSVDGTDVYFFRSYEPGRQDFVTVITDYIPFQDPWGGPNYYPFDEDAVYEIHFDNNGDAQEDITFQFRFDNDSKGLALNVGGKSVKIPLIIGGQLAGAARNPENLNLRETYTIDVVRGDRRSGTRGEVTLAGGGRTFDKPVDNIGTKTFPQGYAEYAQEHIYDVAIPGCGNGRVFVGQREEPFYIAVGDIFDLINYDPLGPPDAKVDNLRDKNITTLAMELPVSCLTNGSEPVVGVYTTSSRRQGKLLNPSPGPGVGNAAVFGGPLSQVSRLGNPLVNEVVIGLDDKDRFNASSPTGDAQFLDYVTNPTLPALIEILFPVQAPTNFPRNDLVSAFLTGLKGVNQPANVVPSEMMRLNTSIPPTPQAEQDPLGVAAGDNAGFPNGRRPGDDVVDIELRVAMGLLCVLSGAEDALAVGCTPEDAPSGDLPFNDGVRQSAADFMNVFPYVNTPIPGSFE